MQSLIFFNKEGDHLNFRYNEDDELWEGDIIFHQNSDDTFKTAGLYVFERIPSFEYERPGDLQLEKFQLFNEYRFDIYGSEYLTQSVMGVGLPNTDPNFYSKWIYGRNFQRYFPIGSQIRFNQPFLEFRNPNLSYTVVKTKKNAIMILSELNNRQFSEQYGDQLNKLSTYSEDYSGDPNSTFTIDQIISSGATFSYNVGGINAIGIYDYINTDLTDNLSSWSEPSFYDRIFDGRVLNLIGTGKNDGIYTVKNVELQDKVYTRYLYDARFLTYSYDLMVDITIKTELPTVYSGPLTLTGSRIYFEDISPKILKPGVEFYLPASTDNANVLKVSDIPQYTKINNQVYFPLDTQVLYNNLIYECIQAHTWSATASNSPDNLSYWKRSSYVPVTYGLVSENFGYTEIHLIKNRFTYSQSFTQSIDVTFGSSVQKYAEDLRFYNIDYYYEDSVLRADLLYPSDYVDIKFFIGSGFWAEVSTKEFISERCIEIEETLKPEINENISENFDYTIVFTDIDEFGIRITVNDQVYYQDVEFLYDGLEVNLERTIDRTLRNWFTSWYLSLVLNGIIPKLKFGGKSFSPYFNAITLTTEYPNVPLKFKVEVGSTANYYVPRKQVILNKLGSYFNVNINGRNYGQSSTSTNGVVDIITSLENWMDSWVMPDGRLKGILPEVEDVAIEGYNASGGYDIYVEQVLSMLSFSVKEQDVRIEISVNPGISVLPGSKDFLIQDLFIGNTGALLSSNSIVLTYATYSFEEEKFATGQLLSINNSPRVWNNQEYNIEYLGPKMINLSYQGPFWSTLDPLCDVAPYVTLALSKDAFGATGCSISATFDPSGEFSFDYRADFSIYFGLSNSYVVKTDFNTKDTKRFVDLIYLNLAKRIYIMGERLTVIDSITGFVVGEVILPDITTGVSLNFNEVNNYLYCLSDNKIYVVDPLYPKLDYVIDLGRMPVNLGINPDNGDVYVSYGDGQVDIWYQDNFSFTPSNQYPETPDSKNYYRFGYNMSEMDMYITADNYLVRLNGSDRTFQDEYNIDGLKPEIFYQPQNSSFYVFDTETILNVNGGVVEKYDLGLRISDWLRQPTGTTSNLSDIYFFDTDLGIAVGNGGLVIRTTNAGDNWNSVTTPPITTNLNTLSIIKTGSSQGTVVAAGDGGKILTSTDFGENWSLLTTLITQKIIDIKFYSNNEGFALIDDPNSIVQIGYNNVPLPSVQTFRPALDSSTKFNSIWGNESGTFVIIVGTNDEIITTNSNIGQQVGRQIRRTQLNGVSTLPGSTLIITVGNGGTILRTTDKTDWHTRYTGVIRDFKSVYFPTSTTGWLVGASGSIYRSENSGLSWTSQNSTVTSTLNSVHFSDPTTGLVGGDGGNIVWTEGGTSWNRHVKLDNSNWTPNKINGVFLISIDTKIVVGDNGTILRVDPSNYRKINNISSNRTIVGTLVNDGTFTNVASITTNGSGVGSTFDVQIVGATVSSITINNRGRNFANGNVVRIPNELIGGQVGGYVEFSISSSISLFDTISVPGITQNLNSVFFVGSAGVIVGNSGVCLHSSNSGSTWGNITIPGIGTTNLLSVTGVQSTFWACGVGGKIAKSTNGGLNWNLTTLGSIDLTSISFRDVSNGTVVDSYGRIYTTTDGGVSWQRNYFDYNSVHFTTDTNGLIAGRNGIVLKTTDGGNIWDYVHTGTTASLTSAYLSADNIAYISGPNGLIRKSNSGGRSGSWNIQDSGSALLKNFAFTDAMTGYVAGDGGIIYKTEKDPPLVRNLAFDNINELMHLSTPDGITTFDLDGNLVNRGTTPEFGPIVINQFDGDIYLASQNNQQIYVYDSKRYYFKYSKYFPDGKVKKLVYNPDRQSVMGIIPNNIVQLQSIFEISVSIGAEISREPFTYSYVGENNYGTLDPNYKPHPGLWVKTREYIRKPRANYNDEPTVDLIWKWEEDQTPEIFLYDFTGEQLTTGTRLSYTGPKPLPLVALNRKANKKIDRTGLSEFQQTIFEEITHSLFRVDYTEDLSLKPTPIEVFIGVNSQNEGVLSSTLTLYKRESISFTVIANSTNSDVIQFSIGFSEEDGLYGMIIFNNNSITNFRQDENGVTRGLKPGQLLKISVVDNVNRKNKYISLNDGLIVSIKKVFTKYMMVDFVDNIMTNEFTQVDNYPSGGSITYLTVAFEVIDKLIGRFNIHSQTEIEDIRYKIELSNTGHLVDPYDTFIFKEYDINEQGIDWTFLNRKRKEMLMVRDQIFPYVGSYKSIINAINFFGYNDLELYEYYRNININSKDFYKLFKVEIPDIFDNSVPGWKENDFIKHTLPNPNFETTNLFNLTFKITDKEGTNVLQYSLAEVLMKLQGLKIWLEKKIVPITHRILDITGRADFVGVNAVQHRSYDVKIINSKQELTPIDFALTEAYLMPINSGSTVYTCQVEFFLGFVPTYSVAPDYFNVKVRTYKTYKEWNAFTTYQIGDRITYYGVIYESVLANNKLKNPRKYSGVQSWSGLNDYVLGEFSNYDREIYQYIGTQSSFIIFGSASTVNPYQDIANNGAYASWFNMTEWKNVDLVPVQTFQEYRITATFSLEEIKKNPPPIGEQAPPIKAGKPYNFTIDSNIDPFIVIEVTSDNGYGQIYTMKKNYEIRGLSDIADPITGIEQIGPFQPIIQIPNIIT